MRRGDHPGRGRPRLPESRQQKGEVTMTRERRRFGRLGRGVTPLLIITAIALLLMPAGLHRAAAQDSSTAVDVETRAVFLHASPNMGEVELSLNWETELEEFGYGDQSDWVDVPPGA